MPSPANSTSTPSSSFRIGNKVTINDPELDLHPNTIGTVIGHVEGHSLWSDFEDGWPILYIPGIPFGYTNQYPVDPQYLTRVPRAPVGGIRVRRTGKGNDRIEAGAEAKVTDIHPSKGFQLEGYEGWFLISNFEVIK